MKKKSDKKTQGLRVGKRIRVREVRVINADGEQLGVMPTWKAMQVAEEAELDLVEVSPSANPPVCKVMDFGKYKYDEAKRERERKKKQQIVETKEIKFKPDIAQHDFDVKLKKVREFLEGRNKVRLVVQFKGRQMAHPETGRNLLQRVCESVTDLADTSDRSSMEGKRMNMMLLPKRKAA